MSDEEIRAKEREGELDLPAILRVAPDRKRRLGLIRLAAHEGHARAQCWQEELGLRPLPLEKSCHLERAVSPRDALGWACDSMERCFEVETAAGLPIPPEFRAAVGEVREQAQGRAGLRELKAAMAAVEVACSRLEQEHGTRIGIPNSLPIYKIEIAFMNLLEPPKQWLAVYVLNPHPPTSDSWRIHLSQDREHLLRDYLWPEVIRP